MALPGGGLVSVTLAGGGGSFAFADGRTSTPIITPTSTRQYGISLNSPYPVNRDGGIAKVSIRITWKFLALSNNPTNPYADVIDQLDALWHQVFFGATQLCTATAYQSAPGGATVQFDGAIVPGTIDLKPYQVRHNIPELSVDVLSDFR